MDKIHPALSTQHEGNEAEKSLQTQLNQAQTTEERGVEELGIRCLAELRLKD